MPPRPGSARPWSASRSAANRSCTEHDVPAENGTERLAVPMPIREAVGLRQDFRSSTAHREILDVDRWSRGGAPGAGSWKRRKRTHTMTTVPLPTDSTRWRCTLCGNLTRFDVTRSSKVVEYVHLDLAGESSVEEREVVSETIESVRCRWCNAVDQIELVDRPGADS